MPPFDPVRDAVLNSPISPSQQPVAVDHPRRATDLAALLNDDPPPPTSTSARSSVHFLLRSDSDQSTNKLGLSHSPPISTVPPQHGPPSRPSSPASSSTSLLTPTTSSPFMPQPSLSTIPYNPRRITPAGSVLIPLSQAEIEMYRNYRGIGTQKLSKRKRTTDEPDPQPVKKLTGDAGVVVEHCQSF
jgi:mRNA (guanine-N7-)-methyltransferase